MVVMVSPRASVASFSALRRVALGTAAAALLLACLHPQVAAAQTPAPVVPPASPSPLPPPAVPAAAASKQGGRVAGRVVDKETGKPIVGAQIGIAGHPSASTDLDGRFRTVEIPAGRYLVVARQFGYQAQQDSVLVKAGQAAIVNFALASKVVELEELTAEAPPVDRPSSEGGLLSIQENAPTVMDGISAEQIEKSPDTNAGDAIARVTGASVVDDKYVIVRGLGERYSSTLLNGVELPSPEPLKKVVPLDIFPASLLESIITTKAGRPDRPGDVTAASVEIRTKEFPENRVLQLNVQGLYNTQSSFQTVLRGPRTLSDALGFGASSRTPTGPQPAAGQEESPDGELWAESIRDVWAPTGEAPLNFSASLSLGGILVQGENPLGAILSLSYNNNTLNYPDRQYQLVRSGDPSDPPQLGYTYQQTSTVVDWGGVLNFTQRLGAASKISFKNLYTNNADETYLEYRGFNLENPLTNNSHGYQSIYIERQLFQTQVTGQHLLTDAANSRLNWVVSYAQARRNEPENRSLLYRVTPGGGEEFIANVPNLFFYRDLKDLIWNGGFDWALPVSVRDAYDSEIKTGVLFRSQSRDFTASTYAFQFNGFDPGFQTLPPDQLFSPENIGTTLTFTRNNGPPPVEGANSVDPSYQSNNSTVAAYALADVQVLPALRLFGGLRLEDWSLVLANGTFDNPQGANIELHDFDPLWSLSGTVRLGVGMNLRFEAYRSVARPEARELSPSFYVPIAGECGYYGNPDLVTSKVLNGGLRWEFYPAAGEIIAAGVFAKYFNDPIFEQVSFGQATTCQIRYFNAESGKNYGLELEGSKNLGFLTNTLRNLYLGGNFTYVSATATNIEEIPGGEPLERTRPFLGQSPYLVNLNLGFTGARAGLQASLLFNYFSNRTIRYGETLIVSSPDGGSQQGVIIPDIVEKGRISLDAKVQKSLGRLTVSLVGKNLTDATQYIVQPLDNGTEVTAGQFSPGVSFGVGFGYDF